MRVFVAIGLPDAVRREIVSAVGVLRNSRLPVAWVPEENLHLTLKFLGEIDPAKLPAVRSALDLAVSPFATFSLESEGAGAFPSTRAPRILWAGFREPLELAGALQDNIEAALSEAGFPREPKAFHPHVTIGRVRGAVAPGWGNAFAASLAGRRFGAVPVAAVRLVESLLSPAGAHYRTIADFPLSG